MELDEYQKLAHSTAQYKPVYIPIGGKDYTELKWVYPLLGLDSETGELTNKLKKIIRGDESDEHLKTYLISELGDILWYISELAGDFDLKLSLVAEYNIQKLEARQKSNTIKGHNRNDE